MFCSECGKKLKDNSHFCTQCGKNVFQNKEPSTCPFCKSEFININNSCPNCKRVFIEEIREETPVKRYNDIRPLNNASSNKIKQPASFSVVIRALLVISLVVFFVYSGITDTGNNSVDSLNKASSKISFPELTGVKVANFNWQYKGEDYIISQTLYDSVSQYYKKQPIVYYKYENDLTNNWVSDYYSMFLRADENDDSIKELVRNIKNEAVKNNLTNDETVELIISFVQHIPYDSFLASKILNGSDDVGPRYPYLVLYDNLGICSGKTFLAYNLLREMGYGVALFEYEEDQHIALGIKCDIEYSTYNSGYCYAESTNPHPIGILAEFDEDSNGEPLSSFDYLNNKKSENPEAQKLGQVKIYLKTDGRSYGGAKVNIDKYNRINQLEKETREMEKIANSYQSQISQNEAILEEIQIDLDYWDSLDSVYMYNLNVEKFNNQLEISEKKIAEYNNYIIGYNIKIEEMNVLINELYGTDLSDI